MKLKKSEIEDIIHKIILNHHPEAEKARKLLKERGRKTTLGALYNDRPDMTYLGMIIEREFDMNTSSEMTSTRNGYKTRFENLYDNPGTTLKEIITTVRKYAKKGKDYNITNPAEKTA